MIGAVVEVACPGNRLVRGPYGGLPVPCGWVGRRRPENADRRPCPRCGDRVSVLG